MSSPQLENGFTRLSNELLDALARIRIPGEARQMLDVIIRKTYGFGKKSDYISATQFMDATGLPKYSVHRARGKLLKLNLIEVTKKANRIMLKYSINKHYRTWKPLAKKVTVTKKANRGNQKSLQTVTKKAGHKRKKETIQKKGGVPPPFKARNYASDYSIRKVKIGDIPDPVRAAMNEFGLHHFRGHEKDVRISIEQFKRNYKEQFFSEDKHISKHLKGPK